MISKTNIIQLYVYYYCQFLIKIIKLIGKKNVTNCHTFCQYIAITRILDPSIFRHSRTQIARKKAIALRTDFQITFTITFGVIAVACDNPMVQRRFVVKPPEHINFSYKGNVVEHNNFNLKMFKEAKD